MASAPQMQLPLFYKALEPLSLEAHSKFKIRSLDRAAFLHTQNVVPLTVDEFPLAQRHYPIIFTGGDNAVPLAVMGMTEGVNVFIDETGKLTDESVYIPAYIRRYPFMLMRVSPDSDDMALCFDPTSEAVGTFDEGMPLFEDGKPTDIVQNLLDTNNQHFQAEINTRNFMRELREMGLIKAGQFSAQADGGEDALLTISFDMIDEEKLDALRGDQLRKIHQNGMLPLIYAQLFSLSMMHNVLQRQAQQDKLPQATPQLPTI